MNQLFCNKCHKPAVSIKECDISPLHADSTPDSRYFAACLNCDEDLLSIEVYLFDDIYEKKNIFDVIYECEQAGYSVNPSTLVCSYQGKPFYNAKSLGQAWIHCLEHFKVGGDTTQIERIAYYEKAFTKTISSHGANSQYSAFAFFQLQAATMGMTIADSVEYANAELDRAKNKALEISNGA
ncbi:hypothetical protein [Pseudoalteromonas nigrifaciens]|uniref:hypothetical protein n=1 Tax=Pseudoalteromonas nigrifaciens TaxID=28109 RepID=UPI003FD44839